MTKDKIFISADALVWAVLLATGGHLLAGESGQRSTKLT
jgi:hypothetical protein